MGRQTTAHGEGFVHAHQSLDPRIDEQVVANANLYRRGIARIDEHHVEECRVEHDVTMVADEGVAVFLLGIAFQTTVVKGATVGVLADDVFDDRLHEALLEVERCLHAPEGQAQDPVADAFGKPRGKALEHE